MRMSDKLPALFQSTVNPALDALTQAQVVERLWAKDHRVWKQDPREIVDRLGWLTLQDQMPQEIGQLRNCASTAKEMKVKDVVLLGMGGSSLGPEVFRTVFGAQKGAPRLWVLDSTVPGWVQQVTGAISPSRTLFLVASKSGGTIEVMSLFAHFWKLVMKAKGNHGGRQFVAITDPGTGLEKMARDYGFGQIFSNPADIGGRYSVLSLFGLVPAALLGLDVTRLLDRAAGMAERCRQQEDAEANPGAYLGAVMGSLAKNGCDKVTVIASPSLATFGLWVEQLLAESTGKEGTGLIPIAQEPVVKPSAYGTDRCFVYLKLKGEKNGALDRAVQALAKAGHPVLQFDLRDRYDLGAEFFRWEFATAIAGHVLGIHPFDQPNVQESKDNTNRVLETFQSTGRLPEQVSSHPKDVAQDLANQLHPGTYLSVLAYTTPSRPFETAVRRLRQALMTKHRVATTFGYGPRYLHSTGQLHKGGPKTGVFLELVDRMSPDTTIPGKPFSFGMLAQAQAVGDLASLRAHDRHAIRVQLGRDQAATVNAITAALVPASSGRRRGTLKKRPKRASR
ncbi:MAG: glucose-6-phosphate isomerase [Nitrospira sp.]|nr:glucose-6-phosphate isomerase [Nitrospira sp.]MDH4249785.1 glucose-6-phosphate isomerase [Nitrospira sp.]MDH4341819.1 glucose-6-phosphate isomerase [Nitrospira sp.]MDH5334877.1 glucose-6-phosphate isomerase [Nitrospira sp.]